jgi:hypothetical protein
MGDFWDSNQVFLRVKLGISGAGISETETGYFWGSNQVFLRLKPGISETETRYF